MCKYKIFTKIGGCMEYINHKKLKYEVFQVVGEVVLGIVHSGLSLTIDDIQIRLSAYAEMNKNDTWKSFVYSSAIDSLSESEK